MIAFKHFVVSATVMASIGCSGVDDPFTGAPAIALGATYSFGAQTEGGVWQTSNAEIVETERGSTQATFIFPNEGDVQLSYTSPAGRTAQATLSVVPVASVSWKSHFGETECVDLLDCPILVGGTFEAQAVYEDVDGQSLAGWGILSSPAGPLRIAVMDTIVIEPVTSGLSDINVDVDGLGETPIRFRSVDSTEIEVSLVSRNSDQDCSIVPIVTADGETVLGWSSLLEWNVDGVSVDWIGPQRCSAGQEFVASVSGVQSAPLAVD